MKTLEVYFHEQSEPLTYLDLAPRSFSAACGAKLQVLKRRLVQRFASEFSDLKDYLVRQAVEEAYALASLTAVPHLLLPVLAEEKVQAARAWAQRQQTIRQQSTWSFAN